MGAFLTQNTNWKNVEIALRQLRSAHVLSLVGIRNVPIRRLEKLVRSSGYFRQKARRLKKFVKFVDQRYDGSLRKMFEQPGKLREELLALEGVGPETADSILLYAGQHPVFVVDAYTRRISERHGLLHANANYDDNSCESILRRCLALAFANEPCETLSSGTGLQRNARINRRCRQAILLKVDATVRRVPAETPSSGFHDRSRLIMAS